jgi:hypothetical protein
VGIEAFASCGCDGEGRGGDAEESAEARDMADDGRVEELSPEPGDGPAPGDVTGEEPAADPDTCGNGACDAGESCSSCPVDGGDCSCGNGTCDPGEDGCVCRADCECGGDCDYSLPPTDGQPLVLYYGFLKDGDVFSDRLNRLLVEKPDGSGNLTDTMEIVFSASGGALHAARGRHASCNPPDPPFSTIKWPASAWAPTTRTITPAT